MNDLKVKAYPKMRVIEGYQVIANLGNYINWGKKRLGEYLNPSDWELADFRLSTGMKWGITSLAANIRISGRKIIYRSGYCPVHQSIRWVKVQIEFVGDGEPSTYSYGEMLVKLEQLVRD